MLPLLSVTLPILFELKKEFEMAPCDDTTNCELLIRPVGPSVTLPMVETAPPPLEITPLDRITPPIEFDTLPGVEIAPVSRMLI